MLRLRAVAAMAPVGAALAGCAQLAGIDNTSHVGDSLSVTRMSIGTTVTTAPQDLTGLSATYLVASNAATGFDRVTASTSARGRWTSNLRTPAAIQFTLPDVPTPVPRLYAFPNPELSVVFGVLEHPAPSPAPDAAAFTVTVPLDTLPAMGELFQSYVVGAWLVRNFDAGEVVATGMALTPPAFSFAPGNSVAGLPTLDLVTSQDAFLVLRYVGAVLTGVAEAMPFDQTGAATTVTTQPMTAVAADQMLDVKVPPAATLMTRFGKAQPAVATLQANWSLVAAPGYRIASNAGPVLRSGGVAAMDISVTAPYGNPFAARGWNAIFTLATSESRNFQLPGTMMPVTGIDLFAGLNQYLEPAAGAEASLPAGLPIVISLNDVPLITDGQAVAQPDKFVNVSFVVNPAPGATGPVATLYNLIVYDLVVPAMATAPVRIQTFSAASNQPKFALPPELFVPGHFYTLRAVATLGGFPHLDDGNFVDRDLPLTQAYLDSAVIAVGAP
jgi:hypothetical protein